MQIGGLPVSKLIGQPAYLSIIHNTSKDGTKTYSNIFSVMKMPKGLPVPQLVNESVLYSAHQHNQEAFDKLPPFIQDKIKQSPEYISATGGNKPTNPPLRKAIDETLGNDEIPF